MLACTNQHGDWCSGRRSQLFADVFDKMEINKTE